MGTGSQNSTVNSVKVTIGGVYETFTIKTKDMFNTIKETNNSIDLSIFPNPTTGKVVIKGITEQGSISVYNNLGQLIKKMTVSGSN